MRQLDRSELDFLGLLTSNGIDVGLLELTETGLAKSILDATQNFRSFLERNAIHDYSIQRQGALGKVLIRATLWNESGEKVESTASLYRPETKKGDPRIWFSGLNRLAKSGDLVAVFWDKQALNLVNISRPLRVGTSLSDYLDEVGSNRNSARAELRRLLEDLGERGWIMARKTGSTAVGHLLETELGIEQNSSKNPDYRGIEIKSSSKPRTSDNRYTLFAKVPTWPLSQLKSSSEILEQFGYSRGENRKLYCTVSALRENSQGLFFRFDEESRNLIECSINMDVATWEEDVLTYTLEQKHKETFWVKAEKKNEDGKTFFRYLSVVNTKNPISPQFIPLLRRGVITMDHLIKRSGSKVSEKGPLFKIRSDSLDQLFPKPDSFELR